MGAEGPGSLQADAILAGRLDVEHSPLLGLSFDPPLVAEQVSVWSWVVAMASDHPLAKEKRLTSKLLAAQPFILYATRDGDEGPLAVVRDLLGCEPLVVHRVTSTLSVLALAAAGLGITLVPAPLSKVAVRNVVYRTIADFGLTSDLVLVSRAHETASAVQVFLNMSRREKTD